MLNIPDCVISVCNARSIVGKRKAAFVAQCAVETANFTVLQEDLYYTTAERVLKVFPSRVKTVTQARELCRNPEKLANFVYANRLGNGSAASGEGWKYSGKGYIQLTGRSNYAEAAKALKQPYLDHPELLLTHEHAALVAAWYWKKTGCNEAIDRGDFNSTTRRINGPAMLHAEKRLALYKQLLGELS